MFPKLLTLTISGFLFLVFASQAHAAIYINEFMAHPSSGADEWVEFYNPDSTDLSTYWIDDDTSFTDDNGNTNKKAMTQVVNPTSNYSYVVLTSALFNNSGDYVVLFAADGTLVDQYQYTSDPGDNVVWARIPSGSGFWSTTSTSTQGSANPSFTPTPTPTPSPVPTNTNTPTPTSQNTPTPTSTPSPTKKPTLTPTPTTTKEEIAKSEEKTPTPEIVLGTTNLGEPPTEEVTKTKKNLNLGKSLMAGGLALIGFTFLGMSGYSLLKGKGVGKKSATIDDDEAS